MNRGYHRIKRAIDVIVGGSVLLATAPIQGAVAFLVRREFGSPVLFIQDRPGLNGEIFQLRKFRTMLEPDEARGLITDEQRLTAFGRFLRSTSLDELPSLWNVVRGDMSLVGPRPLLARYLDRYSPDQARRHEVRPGITGWAQVNGRNAVSWERKLSLDVDYVDSASLGLDLWIILLTIAKVLKREGIAADGEATTHEFRGKRGTDGD